METDVVPTITTENLLIVIITTLLKRFCLVTIVCHELTFVIISLTGRLLSMNLSRDPLNVATRGAFVAVLKAVTYTSVKNDVPFSIKLQSEKPNAIMRPL